MKKTVSTLLLALTVSGSILANNLSIGVKTEPSQKKEKANSLSATPSVWAEEKMGTYRESRMGRFFFGACRKSPQLCMIIFHPDMDPADVSRVRVFPPGEEPREYTVESCNCKTVETSTGVEEQCVFKLAGQ